jgi:hypothetical protein
MLLRLLQPDTAASGPRRGVDGGGDRPAEGLPDGVGGQLAAGGGEAEQAAAAGQGVLRGQQEAAQPGELSR